MGIPQMVVFCQGGWVCGWWCSDGHVLHLCVHPLNVGFVGGVDPFLGRLSEFILYLPLGGLGFATCSNVFTAGALPRSVVGHWVA